MPSLEACEPWVFRRNLLLSVCPVELFPTHQLLLSAEGNTLMLCGPFGSTATAVCVLWWNSLRSTERASCGLGLLAVWAAEVLGRAKETAGASVVWSARARPSCCLSKTGSNPARLCSPCACQGLCLAPRGAQGLKEKEHTGGAQAETFNPNWSVILWYPVPCRLLDRVCYFLELSCIPG